MSQNANVLTMPKPSNKNSATPEKDSGHRSPLRSTGTDGSVAEIPAPVAAEQSTEVFAVFGVEPEIQAYAMAKYSRSALSLKGGLRGISTTKEEKFFNQFFFFF